MVGMRNIANMVIIVFFFYVLNFWIFWVLIYAIVSHLGLCVLGPPIEKDIWYEVFSFVVLDSCV